MGREYAATPPTLFQTGAAAEMQAELLRLSSQILIVREVFGVTSVVL